MADENTRQKSNLNENEQKTSEIDCQTEKCTPSVDKELDDLLDSALEDFDQTQPTGSCDLESFAAANINESNDRPQKDSVPKMAQEDMFNEIFSSELANQANQQLEEMMTALQAEDPDLARTFEKLTDAANKSGDETGQKAFEETLQQTLGSMAQNAEEIQGEDMNAQMLRMLSGMNLGGDDAGTDGMESGFMPMMQGMMESLLSKEVLYPSLKEITSKYPDWLSENKGKVEKSDFDKYSRQYELMSRICEEFESELPSDSAATKKLKFENITELMQEMQELGQPPRELVGEMSPGLQFDQSGMPVLPGMPNQCSQM